MDTGTGVAIETWISDLGLAPAGLGDPDVLLIALSTRGLVTSGGWGGMSVFRTAIPSVAGFFRSMLGRGEEPWAGALLLPLWLWVCTTVVAAGAALNELLIGLATIVAPSPKTTEVFPSDGGG